jgi:hypothetical protein
MSPATILESSVQDRTLLRSRSGCRASTRVTGAPEEYTLAPCWAKNCSPRVQLKRPYSCKGPVENHTELQQGAWCCPPGPSLASCCAMCSSRPSRMLVCSTKGLAHKSRSAYKHRRSICIPVTYPCPHLAWVQLLLHPWLHEVPRMDVIYHHWHAAILGSSRGHDKAMAIGGRGVAEPGRKLAELLLKGRQTGWRRVSMSI